MQNFSYQARDIAGKQVRGVVEAENIAAAATSLRSNNLFIIEVKPAKGSGGNLAHPALVSLREGLKPKVKSKDLAVFCRQFSTMIEAGVPILAAMDILKAQTNHPLLKNTLQGIRSDLVGGNTLAQSLRTYPQVFPPILVNMAEAGEVGGILDQVMARLAGHFEKEHEIQEKVKSAMVYPMVVLVVALLAIVFLLVFVLPSFTNILTNLGVPLPLPTLIVISISSFFQQFWFLVPVLIGAAAVGWLKFSQTPNGKAWQDRTLLSLPVFGEIIRKMIVSRFARTLAAMLKGGVPILQALEVVKRTVGNTAVMAGIEAAQAAIRDGRGMAEPLAAGNVFPPMVIQMISVGEETGTIDLLLEKISLFYDGEVDQVIGRLSSMIEPLMIVGLGGVVGFIILSILLPMFSVVGGIQ